MGSPPSWAPSPQIRRRLFLYPLNQSPRCVFSQRHWDGSRERIGSHGQKDFTQDDLGSGSRGAAGRTRSDPQFALDEDDEGSVGLMLSEHDEQLVERAPLSSSAAHSCVLKR